MLLGPPIADARPFRAMLIDLDNTLVDRDAALQAYLRHHGYVEGLELFGAEHLSMWRLSFELMASRSFPDPTPGHLAERIRRELPGWIEPLPEIRAQLEALRGAGLRIALVSNGGGSTQRAKLAAAGLDAGLFDSLCISEERGVAKPSAGLFELALAELKVDARDAIMIGDSPEHDVVGARRAGVRSCWLARGRRYPGRFSQPDWSAADFLTACRAFVPHPR